MVVLMPADAARDAGELGTGSMVRARDRRIAALAGSTGSHSRADRGGRQFCALHVSALPDSAGLPGAGNFGRVVLATAREDGGAAALVSRGWLVAARQRSRHPRCRSIFRRTAAHTPSCGRGRAIPARAARAAAGLSAADLLLGLAEPFFSADTFPEKRGSICSAANFLPIWLAAGCWLIVTANHGGSPRRRLLWPLFVSLLAFTLFALFPLPPIVGRATLLSFSTEERLILPIGLGGVLLSILALREMKPDAHYPAASRLALVAVCAGGILLAIFLRGRGEPEVFSTRGGSRPSSRSPWHSSPFISGR